MIANAIVAFSKQRCNSVFMDEKITKKQSINRTKSMRLDSSGWYLKILGTWMDNQMNERLGPLGLNLSQFTIIMTLLEKDGLTQVEISRKVMLPAYATTRNIDKLESLGYLERQKHESSRRSLRVRLTETGKGLAPTLFKATKDVNEQFLSPLNESQKIDFHRTLTVLTNCLNIQALD